MRDLTEAGRAVVENPPVVPTPIEKIEATARRRRRRHVRAGVALATAIALLAGALVVAVNRRESTSVAVKPSKLSTVKPAPTATTTPLPGYRVVSYHGVHIDAPVRWPVVDGMHTVQCGDPFPNTPTVFLGPQENGPLSCPYIAPSKPAPNGVWLQPGVPAPDARPVTTSSGQTLLKERPVPGNPVEQLWYHQTSIEIGIGPDPTIAKTIFQSIGFTAGTPDTAAAGVCARQDHPDTMPTPERLSRALVLDGGNETLSPPAPSDRAITAATQVWSESGPKQPFERYRLILARYSDGSLTPVDHNKLAWIIYRAPISPTIAGCGLWGLDVTNALTGKGIGSSAYSQGP